MTDREAMAMALEALETLMIERGSIYEKAITALKERLAEHAMQEVQRLGQEIEQEPLAHWSDCAVMPPFVILVSSRKQLVLIKCFTCAVCN